MSQVKKKLLDHVNSPGYRAAKPKSIAKKIGVTKKTMTDFEAAVEEAVAAGEILLGDSGRIKPKAPRGSYMGTVRRIRSGDAFVILHDPKPPEIDGDLFIGKDDLKDAQSGDEVLVKLMMRRGSRGRQNGYVVDVVERASNIFVGTYFEEDESGWVQIDGKDFREPVWVGDPGAKGAGEGDKVVIEMIRFPSQGNVGEAVLTKVLGARGEVGVETEMIIHQFGIPDEFPDSVLEAARLEAENFDEKIIVDRDDFTDMTIVTIDPATARDFDDAISLNRTSEGHWHLGVHIADVSHFVQPGSELDREAEKRGTSVYLPTKVIPMLPEVISNGLASLQEGRLRFVMSAFIEFTAEGIPIGTKFARSAIKVTQRFAYEEVLPIIETDQAEEIEGVTAEVRKLLNEMHGLATILRKRRFKKGALELDMPEVRLDLDADGNVSGAHETEHDFSHQIIEEFMLAANIAVATELNDRGIAFLRRVHGNPSAVKVKALAEFAQLLGYPLKNPKSRAGLQDLLNRVKGQPEERSINYAFLRSLKQAEYSPNDAPHYALAEDNYCHFTSPIRRYPDLHIHRLIAAVISDNKSDQGVGADQLIRLGRHCSTTERRAEKAERELTKIKLLSHLEERIGEQLEAVITGVDRFGFFARGIELPAEGLVHVTSIPDKDHFEFDRAEMALVGRSTGEMYRLGDRVLVEVDRVDVDERELNFKLVKRLTPGVKKKRDPSKSKDKPGKGSRNKGRQSGPPKRGGGSKRGRGKGGKGKKGRK